MSFLGNETTKAYELKIKNQVAINHDVHGNHINPSQV